MPAGLGLVGCLDAGSRCPQLAGWLADWLPLSASLGLPPAGWLAVPLLPCPLAPAHSDPLLLSSSSSTS